MLDQWLNRCTRQIYCSIIGISKCVFVSICCFPGQEHRILGHWRLDTLNSKPMGMPTNTSAYSNRWPMLQNLVKINFFIFHNKKLSV